MDDKIVVVHAATSAGMAPEDFPPDHPMSDPWHHEVCICGHKRIEHYDEWRFCVACSDKKLTCVEFKEAP